MTEKLEQANLDWEDGPSIRSKQFGDIYFSDIDGLEETRHVYLGGNDLPQRFSALCQLPAHTPFTVGELGFGSGLNIAATCHAWRNRGHSHGHLHLVSVEGFPLCAEDFQKCQKKISDQWPELARYSETLAAHYPPLINGLHTLRLADDITLILAFGHVAMVLPQLSAQVDAWFLDGFSPATNPEMWTSDVLAEVARLSAPAATFATFTVAGDVRRRLAALGFGLKKMPGFGRKREMLCGQLNGIASNKSEVTPWFSSDRLEPQQGKRVLIAGAGIAGASAAWHLKRAGFDVTVYDRAGKATGASGNPAGLVLPRLDIGTTPAARFYLSSWLYTVQLIHDLEEHTGRQILTEHGGLRLAFDGNDTDKNRKLKEQFGELSELLTFVTTQAARNSSGHALAAPDDALHVLFKQGGTIVPAEFIEALLTNIPVERGILQEFYPAAPGQPVRVQLETSGSVKSIETDVLVIATSTEANPFFNSPVLQASMGQLDVIETTPPDCAISFGHYAAPFGTDTIVGATYQDLELGGAPRTTLAQSRQNLQAVSDVLLSLSPEMPVKLSRAAIRAATIDRHPIAGPLPDWDCYHANYKGLRHGKPQNYPPASYQNGIFVLTGLGSRGLTTGPLCGDLLRSQISNAPRTVSKDIEGMIHPARFFIRGLKRQHL